MARGGMNANDFESGKIKDIQGERSATKKAFLEQLRKELENNGSENNYENKVKEFKKNLELSDKQKDIYSDEAYRKFLQEKIEEMALQGYNKDEIMNSLINDKDLKKDTKKFETYTQFFAGWIDNKLSKVTPMQRIQQNDKKDGKDITD